MDLKASCADLSRYVCFVCGCALAARVLAPLRLDEELWWFYVLACGGVLFGPLVGVLPERWHCQATARQLAVARVVLALRGLSRGLGQCMYGTRDVHMREWIDYRLNKFISDSVRYEKVPR